MMRIKTTVVILALVLLLPAQRASVKAYVAFASWPGSSATFFINPQNADVSDSAAEAALLTAMDAWNTQGQSSFHYSYGGRVSDTNTGYDGKNVIVFRNASNGSALASTYYWYSGGTMLDADIVFWDAPYVFFAGTSGCNGGAYIEDVATHEMGHALGLSHSSVADATMYPTYSYCSQDQRTLAADDISGLQSLYGSGGGSTGGGGSGGTTSPTNSAPSVSINSPGNNSSFVEGTTVSFDGSASDNEDGSLTSSLQWSSSLQGLIGTGQAFSTNTLVVGRHVITASVTDSGQLTGSKQVVVTINSVSSPTSSPAKGRGKGRK